MGLATVAFAAALMSKESAIPLPIALLAWDRWIERRPFHSAALRAAPFVALALLWGGVALGMRAYHHAATPLAFKPIYWLASYAHLIQSLLGLENPTGLLRALSEHGPAILPLALIGAAMLWNPSPRASTGGSIDRPPGVVAAYGCLWLIGFGAVTGPVVYNWSAYYISGGPTGKSCRRCLWSRPARCSRGCSGRT